MPLPEKMHAAFQKRFGYPLQDAKLFHRANGANQYKDSSLSILGRGNVTLDVPQRTMDEIDAENFDLIQKISRNF